MAHTLIVGVTEAGKSRLAKRFIEARGRTRKYDSVAELVLDPIGASDWGEGVHVTRDWREFHGALIYYHGQQIPVCATVDEADIFLSQSQRENWWLLQRGRHFGVSVNVLTQRPALVAPTVRGMCTTLHCFQVSESDAKMLADDFACPALKDFAVAQYQGQWCWVRWEDRQKVLTQLSFDDIRKQHDEPKKIVDTQGKPMLSCPE